MKRFELFGAHSSRLVFLALATTACVDAHVLEPAPLSQQELLHRVTVEYPSVIMAVDDTVQMQAIAYDIAGDTIPIPDDAIEWTVDNTEAVELDTTGRLVAKSRSPGPALVVASWTLNDVERSDTAEVWVVDTAYAVASVKVTPLDSSRKGYDEINGLDPALYDIHAWSPDGQALEDVVLSGYLSPPTRLHALSGVAAFGFGMHAAFAFMYTGDVWVKTRALIFGVVYQDSAKYTGLYPVTVRVDIDQSATGVISHQQGFTFLQPCGKIRFINDTETPIDIHFEDETAGRACDGSVPASGTLNIPPGEFAERVVSAIGTIRWRGRLSTTNTAIQGLTEVLTVRDVP